MKAILVVAIQLFLALLILSCKSDTVGPGSEKFITGIVRDTLGRPVPNAYLNFNFRYRLSAYPGVVVDTPTVIGVGPHSLYQFDVPIRSFVSMVKENYLHQHIKTLINDTLERGAWDVEFIGDTNVDRDEAGRDIYSDVYFIKLSIGSSVPTEWKFVQSTAQHLSSNPLPYAQTDWFGNFAIPFSRLPFKEIFFASPNDTGTFDDQQILTAFTQSSFGRSNVSISNPQLVRIVLNRSK